MLSSALAAHTITIEIMPAVHPGIVLPQLVAKFGASLDRISAGRAPVNIVNGWWADEFNMYGNGSWIADPAARGRRMSEFISVLKGLWTENPFTFEGEFFGIKEGRHPPREVLSTQGGRAPPRARPPAYPAALCRQPPGPGQPKHCSPTRRVTFAQ